MKFRKMLLLLTLVSVLVLTACGKDDKDANKDTGTSTNTDSGKGDGADTDPSKPNEQPEDPIDDERDLTLEGDYVKALLNDAVHKLLSAKGAEVAAHAPSFTPADWLEDSRYTITEESNWIKSFEINEIQIIQYSEEDIQEVYEGTSLSYMIKDPDALKDVKSLAVIRYTYDYEDKNGETGTETAEDGSDFLMAYENGEWRYVFHDSVPDNIAEYFYKENMEELIGGTYKVTSVERYEKGEKVSMDWAELAAKRGLGAEAWTFELTVEDEEHAIDEEDRTSLKGVLKGEGQEYERWYMSWYIAMHTGSLRTTYDADKDVFCGFKVGYHSEIDLEESCVRLKLEYWEDLNCETYYLVMSRE